MHGLGNDFVIVDARELPFNTDPDRIRRLANRHTGIGCDQILIIQPSDSPSCLAAYSVYNADGSRVQQCGNGVRCLARWLSDREPANGSGFTLIGAAGPVAVAIQGDQVRVDMGPPCWQPRDIPLDAPEQQSRYQLMVNGQAVTLGAVSMGNPHAVIQVADIEQAPLDELGSALQAHPAFPESVNVGVVQVLDPGHICLRVYERGVGETQACGTGACAAMACGRLWGLLDQRVTVSLPGGDLTIDWDTMGDPVFMLGPAHYSFEGHTEL
jgi:diaminopimelate epimerase